MALQNLSGPRRRWPATTRPSPSGPTTPTRSPTAALRSKTSSGPRRRWPATTRPSPSARRRRRAPTAATRSGPQATKEALASYDKALAIRPDYAKALDNRGLALQDLKRPEEALASYDKALALRPDDADASTTAAMRSKTSSDPRRRWPATTRPSPSGPTTPGAQQPRQWRSETSSDPRRRWPARQGPRHQARRRQGAQQPRQCAPRPEATRGGAGQLRQGARHQARYAEALNNRGNALQDLKRPEEALASYDKALAIRPDYAEALNNRGKALQDLKRPEEALASYDKALAIRPDYAEALDNRGNALHDLKRPEEALASYDKALAIRPDYAEALNNRGIALHDLKRPEEALASFDKALAIRPDHAEALFNRALSALLMGDFSAGWRGYEYRWDRTNAEARKLLAPYPNWKGEDIRGKRIIVYEEQGLGDIIQFSRFLTQLVALNAEVTFLLRSTMHRLLSVFAPSVRLVAAPPKDEAFDFQCALMSLPGAFGTSCENLPSSVPYLLAEEGVVARWRERLGDHGLKIGICWQGNPDAKADIGRSFPLRCLQPLAAISGVRLISLQKAHGLDQLGNLPSGMEVETLGRSSIAGRTPLSTRRL